MLSTFGMVEGCMKISIHMLHLPRVLNLNKSRIQSSIRSNPSSILVHTDENGNMLKPKSISTSLLRQANTVGVMGGVSVLSTLIFVEKLVRWSEEVVPLVVYSDTDMNRDIPLESKRGVMVESLRRKRVFLEQCGAGCIVMACHGSHAWHEEVSEGCCVPLFHVGDCVATELKEHNFRPLEAGSNVRVGVLTTDIAFTASFYQDKLQTQGFEVVYPDKATMEHIVIPIVEAMHSKDMEGARNLLRIAIRVLLVRAVNTVILASDQLQGVLPLDDPLLDKCIDPMDALARSTIKWAQSAAQTG